MSGPVAPLVVVLTLVVVLVTSGVAKARAPLATRDAFTALRVPSVVPVGPAAAALPWVEIVLAVLLVAAPVGWLVPAAAVVAALMLVYTALVARALRSGEPVTCACFGSLGRHTVDRTTLARNVLLVVLAGVVAGWALDGGAVLPALGDLDSGGWWALAATCAAAAVAVLVVGVSTGQAPDGEVLDYERQPTPYGVLTDPDGRTSTLAELTSTQARLLVVLKPGCGPCVRTAEKLDGWAAQLAPAVGVLAVYPDEASATHAHQHLRDLSTWEPERNIRRVFSVGSPAAVLLGADGYLAGGPVAGEEAVARFVDEVLEAIAEPTADPADPLT